MEGFGVAAVDAGIAGTLITAAESLGLGIVPIGQHPPQPADMMTAGLPPLTFRWSACASAIRRRAAEAHGYQHLPPRRAPRRLRLRGAIAAYDMEIMITETDRAQRRQHGRATSATSTSRCISRRSSGRRDAGLLNDK
jgi:hypothetical protein